MLTTVLVHGNPESAHVWDPLLDEIRATRSDVRTLSPPGFGAPVPDGFGCTFADYRDWLVGELESLDGPVDLVGHDVGGVHVINVVLSRPDLVRSWVSDVLGIYDPGYAWHELARRWQTPGVGEADVAARFGAPLQARIDALLGRGMGVAMAAGIAANQDEAMGRAILALYRSGAGRVPGLGVPLERAAQRPGLALVAPADDLVGSVEQRRRAAGRAGARVEVLDGLGHWWMVQDPVRGVAALTAFWSTTK